MLVLEYASGYGLELSKARFPKPEDGYNPQMPIILGDGESHSLKHLNTWKIEDILDKSFYERECYTFPGCSNWAREVTPEEWDRLLAMEKSAAAEEAERERKEREEWERQHPSAEKVAEMKEAYMTEHGITDCLVESETIHDEGGKTCCYHWTVTVNGKDYHFVERNIFDFGITINPEYKVKPDLKKGGLVTKKDDGNFYFETFYDGKGYGVVRPLTKDEAAAYELISTFGKYGKYGYAIARM